MYEPSNADGQSVPVIGAICRHQERVRRGVSVENEHVAGRRQGEGQPRLRGAR